MQIDLQDLLNAFQSLSTDFFVHAYMWALIADLTTGWLKAIKLKEVNSSIGLFGLIKHTLVAILLLTLYPYLTIAGFEWVGRAIIIFFIVTYATSLLENLTALNIKVPEFIKDVLAKVIDNANKGEFK